MVLSFVLLALTAIVPVPAHAREIQVKLQAPWAHRTVHPLVEVAEFLAEQSANDFWTYVDTLCSSSSSIDVVDAALVSNTGDSLHSIFQLAQSIGAHVVPSNVESILEAASNLGMYLPAVQFYESITDASIAPCGAGNAFVIHYPGGTVSCAHEHAAVVNTTASSVGLKLTDDTVNMPWNHEYPFGPEKKSAAHDHLEVQVLYGVIGSSSFCDLHTHLSAVASEGLKRYIARHAFPHVGDLASDRMVQGYGVFLDIKNMEYRNVAETKEDGKEEEGASVAKGEDSGEDVEFDPEEEVEGVSFSRLLNRYPLLGKELVIAREELLTKAEEGERGGEMKMWRVHDLGLQTTQSIIAAGAGGGGVAAMNNLLHNFPKHASSLSSVRVDDSLKETIMHYYRSGVMGSVPVNSLFINGLRVDLSAATLNVFDVLSNIRLELKNSDYLSQRGVSAAVKKELLRHAAGLTSQGLGGNPAASREEQMMDFVRSVKRVDVSKGGKYAIQFLNNLEKDAQYKRLPKSVMSLLQPSWQLTGLSRNIYTLVAVLDPVSVEGASMLFQINQIYEQQYPVRIGVVWACNAALSPAAVLSDGASAEDVCHLFSAAKGLYGFRAALSVVHRISTRIEEEAEDSFQPSFEAAQGSIASAAAHRDIFVTKDQAAELYAEAISSHKKQWTAKNDYYEEAVSILREKKGADFVQNTTQYLTQRGLPMNSFSLNGMVEESSDISNLMQMLGREQQMLSILVSMKKVSDKSKSIFSSILKASPSFSRYHSLIEEASPVYIDTTGKDYQLLEQHMGRVFDSRELSLCGPSPGGAETAQKSFSRFYNTTIVALPVHTSFGLRSLHAAVTWFLESVAAGVEDGDMTCRAVFGEVEGGHRLGVVLRAPAGSAPIQDLQRVALLSVMLQSAEPQAIYVLKTTLELLLDDASSLQKVVQQLRAVFYSEESSAARVLAEVVSMLSAVGEDPTKVLAVLEGRLAVSTHLLKASAYATRAFDSPEVSDVVLHFNSRKLVVSSVKGTPLHALDLAMLVDIEYPRLGAPLAETLRNHPEKITKSESESGSDRVGSSDFEGEDFLFMASYCGRYASTGGSRADVMGVMEASGFDVEGSSSGHFSLEKFVLKVGAEGSPTSGQEDVSLIFVVDPLTMAGQRAAAMVKLIQEHLRMPQTVIFVPQMDISDFPLQNFFRFIAPASSASASGTSSLSGIFKKLPRQHTLTVRIDTPEAWNVQTLAAEQDIDNFKCSKFKCGDEASGDESGSGKEVSRVSYQLKNIAIAGQCYEGWGTGRPSPPNGLQLVLNRSPSPLSLVQGSDAVTTPSYNDADTLVMKNLGYFQLQANPGLWQLGLAKGRAASLYTLDDAGAQESLWMSVLSFTSASHQLFVTKRPGMEAYSLLDAEGDEEGGGGSEGMWSKLSAQVQGLWGSSGSGSGAVVPAAEEDERIHVFSLATGQVYERLLRIMMLSAVKRTSVPIKFWLFEYYLSPAFKETVEAMSAEYNFEVAYVVYKWPEWLNQQTEKQRIIWGYKILFLDVLFPLNVKKVIYVDADQVVRADLKELWDMDLEGKPYAYTPFCDSRKETLGFQFWRQGYWADHLRGRPYHISALYVVDLQVFRRKAVGDSLRAVYDQLSKDPNSLSNLDQDLPNYAQHVVPIHSLPQEWLWCESWCSDATKGQAKTIDLCNNPLHKEPKLDMAKRVINGSLFPESWVELDEEIKHTITRTGLSVDY